MEEPEVHGVGATCPKLCTKQVATPGRRAQQPNSKVPALHHDLAGCTRGSWDGNEWVEWDMVA